LKNGPGAGSAERARSPRNTFFPRSGARPTRTCVGCKHARSLIVVMRLDMRLGMRLDMRLGMRLDMRLGMRLGMRGRYSKKSTIPVSRLYIAPAIFMLPADSIS
jgi:hypothetical protein